MRRTSPHKAEAKRQSVRTIPVARAWPGSPSSCKYRRNQDRGECSGRGLLDLARTGKRRRNQCRLRHRSWPRRQPWGAGHLPHPSGAFETFLQSTWTGLRQGGRSPRCPGGHGHRGVVSAARQKRGEVGCCACAACCCRQVQSPPAGSPKQPVPARHSAAWRRKSCLRRSRFRRLCRK